MMPDEITEMIKARASLVRQRSSITKRVGSMELAAVSAAADLTTVLLAIESLDRALRNAERAEPAGVS